MSFLLYQIKLVKVQREEQGFFETGSPDVGLGREHFEKATKTRCLPLLFTECFCTFWLTDLITNIITDPQRLPRLSTDLHV